MTDNRSQEIELRELAYAHRNELEDEQGTSLDSIRLSQMVSLRLEAELAAALRDLANRRGTSVSELLREGAALLLERETESPPAYFVFEVKRSQTAHTYRSTDAASTGRNVEYLDEHFPALSTS